MPEVRDEDIRNTETAVVCRPAGAVLALFWVMLVVEALFLLCTFADVFLSSGVIWSTNLISLLILDACFLYLCIVTGLYSCRACIIANVEGLRWRRIGRWKAAEWENISAYYSYRQKTSSEAKLSVQIYTFNGTLVISPEEWASSAQLLESIKQKAVQVSGPGLSGARSRISILPLNCRYDTVVNRNILRWLGNLHTYGLAAVAIYFAYQWWSTHSLPGWEWLLTPTGLFIFVKQTLPLFLRPLYRATQPRLGDKVIADQEYLRFINMENETAIRWTAITDLYKVGFRYVIVTAEGQYDFLDTLTNSERLRVVIPSLAVNTRRTGWRQKSFY